MFKRNEGRSPLRVSVIILISVLIIVCTAAILLLTGVIGSRNKESSSGTGTTEQGTVKEPEPADQTVGENMRVDQSIVENMAEAVKVDGITVTDEMLEKGILNEGNKARLMQVMERAAKGEEITIAYIGGSITAGSSANPMSTACFAALTTDWWRETFKAAKINYVNAGIGATDSWVGVHRVKDDVIAEAPDLVVAEFAVNDGNGWNQETYDSLLRELLTAPSGPAVISLMIAHKYGSFADKHAPVAFRYKVPIISYSALLTQKLVPWDKVGNSDGTHPDNPGHQLIAHLLTSYYRKVLSEINETEPEEYTVPDISESATRCRYMNGDILFSDETEPESSDGFEAGKVTKILFNDNGWKTGSAGSISFKINASEVGIMWLQKKADPKGTYADYELYIDGEKKAVLAGVADSWGAHLEYKSEILGDTAALHTIELRPAEGNTGTEFEILGIGVSGVQ